MIFAGDHYYPIGGMEDFITSADDFEGACKAVKEETGIIDWFQIYDTVKMKEVTNDFK